MVAVEHHLQAFSTLPAGPTNAAQARCCRRYFQCTSQCDDHGAATATALGRCQSLADAVYCLTAFKVQDGSETHRQIASQSDPEQADADFELQELEKDQHAV